MRKMDYQMWGQCEEGLRKGHPIEKKGAMEYIKRGRGNSGCQKETNLMRTHNRV